MWQISLEFKHPVEVHDRGEPEYHAVRRLLLLVLGEIHNIFRKILIATIVVWCCLLLLTVLRVIVRELIVDLSWYVSIFVIKVRNKRRRIRWLRLCLLLIGCLLWQQILKLRLIIVLFFTVLLLIYIVVVIVVILRC